MRRYRVPHGVPVELFELPAKDPYQVRRENPVLLPPESGEQVREVTGGESLCEILENVPEILEPDSMPRPSAHLAAAHWGTHRQLTAHAEKCLGVVLEPSCHEVSVETMLSVDVEKGSTCEANSQNQKPTSKKHNQKTG